MLLPQELDIPDQTRRQNQGNSKLDTKALLSHNDKTYIVFEPVNAHAYNI